VRSADGKNLADWVITPRESEIESWVAQQGVIKNKGGNQGSSMGYKEEDIGKIKSPNLEFPISLSPPNYTWWQA